MKDEFTNRLGMFDTTLVNLNKDDKKVVWVNQPPVVFTAKVSDAAAAVVDLRVFCRKQETAITGAAKDKEREGKEAIEVAHTLGRALIASHKAARIVRDLGAGPGPQPQPPPPAPTA